MTKITFGKHNGKSFDQVPVSYLQWMAEQSIQRGGVNFSAEAKAYLTHRSMDVRYTPQEREEARESIRQEDEQAAEWEERNTLSWTMQNGKHVEIRLGVGQNAYGLCDVYEISVDGRRIASEYEVVDLPQPPAPGIVARVGNIGLTAERRDTLKKMMN